MHYKYRMSGRFLSTCCDSLALDFRSGGNALQYLGMVGLLPSSVGYVGCRRKERAPASANSPLWALQTSILGSADVVRAGRHKTELRSKTERASRF